MTRKKQLIDAGVAVALVALTSTTDSESTRELLAKVFRAVAEDEKNRGLMVQQGAVKVCLRSSLTLQYTNFTLNCEISSNWD